jgi:hypothetical protein
LCYGVFRFGADRVFRFDADHHCSWYDVVCKAREAAEWLAEQARRAAEWAAEQARKAAE